MSDPQGVRAGLFIYKAFSLPAVFPSLAFGSLQSFRKETDLAGMFFVPAFLFTGGEREIYNYSLGGWGGVGEKKFRAARRCLFFLMLNAVPQTALVPLGALPSSPPFPSAGSLWQAEAQLNSSTFFT